MGVETFGVESRQRMNDEGRSAFQLQSKEELYRERRGYVQGPIPVEHRKRWELAQMRSNNSNKKQEYSTILRRILIT